MKRDIQIPPAGLWVSFFKGGVKNSPVPLLIKGGRKGW